MSDPLFTPFEPTGETPVVPSPTTQPGDPKASAAPETPKRKRGRPSTKPPETPQAAPPAPAAEQPAKPPRKPRAVSSVRTPVNLSLPVSTVLAAVKDLHGDDTALFEKLLGILAAAGKGQRERVIAALGKVFS